MQVCRARPSASVWDVNRRRKGTGDSLAALKSIRAAGPDGSPSTVANRPHTSPKETVSIGRQAHWCR